MLRLISFAMLSTALTLAPAAQAFEADNGVGVDAAQGGILVTGDAGQGARGMWCAAADYARDVLGAAGYQRLYVAVARSPGLGQRAPVLFTTDAAGLDPAPVFLVGASLARAGSSLSVDHALGFCRDARGAGS
jgi:hypothetical protein